MGVVLVAEARAEARARHSTLGVSPSLTRGLVDFFRYYTVRTRPKKAPAVN